MLRRNLLLGLGLLLALAAGWWVYRNASIHRLRAEFQPWMARLERWRDACETTRRALHSRDATVDDPRQIASLREWAWKDMARLGYVDYRVEKPTHQISRGVDDTTGRVTFTVGGFRSDGARIERAASVTVARIDESSRGLGLPSNHGTLARLESPLWDRIETAPRFHEATSSAGLGAPRHDPPLKLVNHLITDIWPGSGVAVLDYDRDGNEDLFVGDGVRSILYRNDGQGHFTDVTERDSLVKKRRWVRSRIPVST